MDSSNFASVKQEKNSIHYENKEYTSIILLPCIGVSCSMEDDILNNVDMGGVGTNIANTEAVFAFSLSGNSSMTKAGEITENPNDVTSTESSISNCFVAIIKDDNVLSSYWYATSDLQTSSESFTTDIERHMIVKVPSDKPALTAYAVANLTQTTADKLLACTTIAGIRDVELAEPNFLVKVGEQPIGSYKTTTQLATHDDVNCNKITIPVSQRVAAFELASFKVVDTSKEKVDGEYPVVPNVEVVSVQMLNIKLSAKVVGEYGSSFSGVDDNILKPTDVNQSDPKKDIYGTYDKIRFYGYDNTDVDRQTSMKITYKVDGAVMDRTYPIKTKPGDAVKVVGGNLYKLSVTIGNASEDIDFVIEDWIPNTLSVGGIFGEPVK